MGEDKVIKVEKERDAALALKAKAEQELTQAMNDLHQAKVLQYTTTSIDKCMRKNAEKQLKLCKEYAKRKEQTIRSCSRRKMRIRPRLGRSRRSVITSSI